MSGLDQFKAVYFEECQELLDASYAALTELGAGAEDPESLNTLFRAVHSIKGSGAAFGFKRLVGFVHLLESALDALRDGNAGLVGETLDLLVKAIDVVGDLVVAAQQEPEAVIPIDGLLVAGLEALAANAAGAAAIAGEPASPAKPGRYRISFVPHPELFQYATEPLLLFRELGRLGSCRIQADASRLPSLERFDPRRLYLSWTIDLQTEATPAQIADVFEFVSDNSMVSIEAEAWGPDFPAPGVPARALVQPAEPAAPPDLSAYEPLGAEPREPRPAGAPVNPAASAVIRVDVERIDRLVNLVGELVISQAMLTEIGSALPPDLSPGLMSGLGILAQHLRELQDSVMAIRAQPVKSVFSRMPRLVREVAAQLGKDVRLVISGESTEIDKTVIEQLANPLTHLLRNALDHGLESPDDREQAGKPRQGTIRLAAGHRRGRIMIEVADDGRGINQDRVLAIAKTRGLVREDAVLAAAEIDDLIFRPGFSTSATISNISGRGVGLDVVRQTIMALGGRIAVESRSGEGARFVLSLPLTLAVLDGMAISVGNETYILPITSIIESLRPRPGDIRSPIGQGNVLALRGAYIPLVYLHQVFNVPNAEPDPCRGVIVIVETEDDVRLGLVVDSLLGQSQVVVKSLETNYGAIRGISGATILGTGRVALILDVAQLCDGVAAPRKNRPSALAATAPQQ